MKEDLIKKFLSPSKKVGFDKAASPEETLKRLDEAFKNSGIKLCSGVERVDKGRLGIPVYMSFYDIEGRAVTGKYKQMGKGSTEELAKVSALMELVERFSIFSFIEVLETLSERGTHLDFEEVIPKEELLKAVEDDEDEDLVIKLLDEVPMHYVRALDVTGKREVWLPFLWFWLIHEYNGSAAGNTYPEAAMQGLCEVIERHVSELFTRGSHALPEVIPEPAGEELEKLLEAYQKLGVKLWIRDMTHGMPVPTLGVMAMDPSTFPKRSEIVFTAGTSTSPERALIRALTEVAQLAGDFDTEGRYEESGLPKFRDLKEAEKFTQTEGKLTLKDLPDISKGDHAEELLELADALSKRGFKVYLIDVTQPLLGIPVVYSVIPGTLFRERAKISPLHHLIKVANFTLPSSLRKELLERLTQQVPERYFLWGYLGTALKEEGKFDEALMAYEKALRLEPPIEDAVAILTHISELHLRSENYSRAVETALKALELKPLAEVYNLLGRAYYKLGDYYKAMDAFLQATELNPASAIDYANIGYCLKALNQLGAAVIYFRKALVLDPDLTMAKRGLEYCEAVLNSQN